LNCCVIACGDFETQLPALQWQGEIQTVDVIEHGLRWINAYVVAENMDPLLYPVGSIISFANNRELPLFAMTDSEKLFFVSNNVTLLSTPAYGVGEVGYNNGSYLLGLRNLF